MKKVDQRLEIAEDFITIFRQHPHVQSAFTRGSLARGTMDRFSDIDIGVDVSGYDNATFLLKIPALVQAHFPFTSYASNASGTATH